MKLLTTAILSSAIALSSMAAAAGTDNPTVAKKTVSYVCQQGKKVKVTYGFNKQGLTLLPSSTANACKCPSIWINPTIWTRSTAKKAVMC